MGGFTQNGIVNQCYCPERNYSDDGLYETQRDKMTEDYADSRILKHVATKKEEVLKQKAEALEQYDYIDENFVIVIQQKLITLKESVIDLLLGLRR